MTDREKIKSIIELFIAWNGETEVIDIANLDSAVDFIINSLPEEPKFTFIEKEVVDDWTVRIDRKRIPITLKGDIKAKFRNEFHTMWQTVGEMQFANVAKAIMERLCLHFAAWGSYNLKDLGVISKEEKAKMDVKEEPVKSLGVDEIKLILDINSDMQEELENSTMFPSEWAGTEKYYEELLKRYESRR